MRFYRRWQAVSAISFDLDNTLYDNHPAIVQAEKWMLHHLRSQYPSAAMLDERRWQGIKERLINTNPTLAEDVCLLRQSAICELLVQGGMPLATAESLAKEVFSLFLIERSRVNISLETHQLLRELAQRYPLIVITNGNLDLAQAGLAPYFSLVYKANIDTKMKPAPDMFIQARQQLKLMPQQILHVGDDPITDVVGANMQGFKTAWLNDRQQSWRQLKQLPDVELTALTELADLLL